MAANGGHSLQLGRNSNSSSNLKFQKLLRIPKDAEEEKAHSEGAPYFTAAGQMHMYGI